MRKKRPLERKPELKRDATLVVIASEDRYAVKQYFELFHSTRIQFRVLATEHNDSAPQHVMSRLEAYMAEYDFGEGDQFWIVLDTDHWIGPGHIQNLVEVVRLCRQKGIGVALTNPCFDLWLLLHFDEFPSEQVLTCEQVGQKIRDKTGQYNKTKIYNLDITQDHVTDAVRRSAMNQQSGGDIPTELQTTIHLIIEDLIQRGMISVSNHLAD